MIEINSDFIQRAHLFRIVYTEEERPLHLKAILINQTKRIKRT